MLVRQTADSITKVEAAKFGKTPPGRSSVFLFMYMLGVLPKCVICGLNELLNS